MKHTNDMSNFEIYKRFWTNGLDFKGRARRREYWIPALFHFIFAIAFLILFAVAIAIMAATSTETSTSPAVILLPILYFGYLIFCLAVTLPNLSVSIRRLHDIGKSGWWILLFMFGPSVIMMGSLMIGAMVSGATGAMNTPSDTMPMPLLIFWIIGCLIALGLAIWCLILFAKDSQPGNNKWGSNPKDPSTVDVYDNREEAFS